MKPFRPQGQNSAMGQLESAGQVAEVRATQRERRIEQLEAELANARKDLIDTNDSMSLASEKAEREKMSVTLALKQEVSVERTEMLHVSHRAQVAEEQVINLTTKLSQVRAKLGEAEQTILRKTLQVEHAAEVSKAEIDHLKQDIAAECSKSKKVETELNLQLSQLAAANATEATLRKRAEERAVQVKQLQEQLRSASSELAQMRASVASQKRASDDAQIELNDIRTRESRLVGELQHLKMAEITAKTTEIKAKGLEEELIQLRKDHRVTARLLTAEKAKIDRMREVEQQHVRSKEEMQTEMQSMLKNSTAANNLLSQALDDAMREKQTHYEDYENNLQQLSSVANAINSKLGSAQVRKSASLVVSSPRSDVSSRQSRFELQTLRAEMEHTEQKLRQSSLQIRELRRTHETELLRCNTLLEKREGKLAFVEADRNRIQALHDEAMAQCNTVRQALQAAHQKRQAAEAELEHVLSESKMNAEKTKNEIMHLHSELADVRQQMIDQAPHVSSGSVDPAMIDDMDVSQDALPSLLVTELELKKAEVSAARSEVDEMNYQIQALNAEIRRLHSESDESSIKVATLQSGAETAREEQRQLRSQIKDLLAKVTEAQEASAKAQEHRDSARDEATQLASKVELLNVEVKRLQAEHATTTAAALNQAEKSSSQVRDLTEAAANASAVQEQMLAQVADLKAKVQTAQKTITETESDRDSAHTKVRELANKVEELQNRANLEQRKYETAIASAQEECSISAAKVDELTAAAVNASAVQEQMLAQVADLKAKVQTAQKTITETESDRDSAYTQVQSLTSKVEELNVKAEQFQLEHVEAITAAREEADKSFAEIEELKSVLSNLQKQIESAQEAVAKAETSRVQSAADATARLTELQQELDKALESVTSSESACTKAQKEALDTHARLDALQKELIAEHQRANTIHQQLNDETSAHSVSLDDNKQMQHEITQLRAQLQDTKAINKSLTSNNEEQKRQNDELGVRCKGLESDLTDSFAAKTEELAAMENRLTIERREYEVQLRALQSEAAAAQTVRSQLQQQLETSSQTLLATERAVEDAKTQSKLSEQRASSEITKLRDQLDTLRQHVVDQVPPVSAFPMSAVAVDGLEVVQIALPSLMTARLEQSEIEASAARSKVNVLKAQVEDLQAEAKCEQETHQQLNLELSTLQAKSEIEHAKLKEAVATRKVEADTLASEVDLRDDLQGEVTRLLEQHQAKDTVRVTRINALETENTRLETLLAKITHSNTVQVAELQAEVTRLLQLHAANAETAAAREKETQEENTRLQAQATRSEQNNMVRVVKLQAELARLHNLADHVKALEGTIEELNTEASQSSLKDQSNSQLSNLQAKSRAVHAALAAAVAADGVADIVKLDMDVATDFDTNAARLLDQNDSNPEGATSHIEALEAENARLRAHAAARYTRNSKSQVPNSEVEIARLHELEDHAQHLEATIKQLNGELARLKDETERDGNVSNTSIDIDEALDDEAKRLAVQQLASFEEKNKLLSVQVAELQTAAESAQILREQLQTEVDSLQKKLAEHVRPVIGASVEPNTVDEMDINEDALPVENGNVSSSTVVEEQVSNAQVAKLNEQIAQLEEQQATAQNAHQGQVAKLENQLSAMQEDAAWSGDNQDRLQAQVAKLESQATAMQKSMAEAEANQAELRQQLDKHQQRADDAGKQVLSLEKELEASRAAADKARSEEVATATDVERLRAELVVVRKELAERMPVVSGTEVEPDTVDEMDINEDALPVENGNARRSTKASSVLLNDSREQKIKVLNNENESLRSEVAILRKQLVERAPPVTCIKIDALTVSNMDIYEDALPC